jgi:hypothetical protein
MEEHSTTDEGAAGAPPSPPSAPEPAEEPLPQEQAPQEIEQDAIAELDRIHEAHRFAAPPADAMGHLGVGMEPNYGMSPIAAPMPQHPVGGFTPLERPEVHRREEPTVPSKRDLQTLEDLYDAYPEIGDGSHYLRVERKHPTRYGGQFIAGFLTDLHEQITLSEFAQRFGGQVYEVSVRGPGRGSTLDSEGRIQARTLTSITVKVPGVPVFDQGQPSNGGSMGTPTGSAWGREDPRVTMKRMEHDADALRRAEAREQQLRREAASRSNLSPDLMRQMNEMAEQRAQETRSASAEIITDLRDEKRRLTEALRERDVALDKIRQQLVHVQTDVQQRLRDEETRQVRELKLQQESSLARTKDEHAATIQRMQQDHERRINEMNERHTRECESIRQNEARERERLRDDANRREKNLQDDFNRRELMFKDRESSLKDDFARREDSLRRDYEGRFQQLERSSKRDLEVIRSSESTKAELAQQTANMQANLHLTEIQRLQSQAESAESQAQEAQRELNKHTNKPLLQQVEETKTIAETLGLMDKKEEPFDWKKGAVTAVKSLIDKAPDIAKGLGDAREQNRVAVARAQQAAHHAQVRGEQQRRRAMMQQQPGAPQMAAAPPAPVQQQPGAQPEQRSVPRPPPPPGIGPQPRTWDAGPPDPSQYDLPPEPAGPPAPEPPLPSPTAGKPQEPAEPPIMAGPAPPIPTAADGSPHPSDMPGEAQKENPVADVPQETAEAAQQPVEQPAEQPVVVQVTNEQVAKFSEKLEEAIASGLVTPAMFADGFIAETSPETTLAIVQAIGPDQLVDAVAQQPGAQSTAIVTREGRKFVQELWTEASQKAIEMLQGGVSEQEG